MQSTKAIENKVTAIEKYLLENGPQTFPKLFGDEEQWQRFENLLEANSTIYIDRDAKLLRLSEVEKELFEFNNGKKLRLSSVTNHLRKYSSKHRYLAENLSQKVIEYFFHAKNYLIWGDEVISSKHNQQKLPKMAEYLSLYDIYKFLKSTCGREDEENDIVKPFYPLKELKKLGKAYVSKVKRNPMFFTINNSARAEPTVSWNRSAFIFDVSNEKKQKEIRCCLRNSEEIQSVSRDFVSIYIQQYLRQNKDFASIETLFSAIQSLDAPVQLHLCDIDTSAELLQYLADSSEFRIERNSDAVTVSINRNSAWEELCSDLAKKDQIQAASIDKTATDSSFATTDSNFATTDSNDDFICLDCNEFRLLQKQQQEAKKKDSTRQPPLQKSRTKACKSRKGSSGKNAPATTKEFVKQTSLQKRNSARYSNQKHNSNPHTLRQSQFRGQETPNNRNNRYRTQQEPFVKSNDAHSRIVSKRHPNSRSMSNSQRAASTPRAPRNTAMNDMPPPFPPYKPKPLVNRGLNVQTSTVSAESRPNFIKTDNLNSPINDVSACLPAPEPISKQIFQPNIQMTSSTRRTRPNPNQNAPTNPSMKGKSLSCPSHESKASRSVQMQKPLSLTQKSLQESNMSKCASVPSTFSTTTKDQTPFRSSSDISALARLQQQPKLSANEPHVQTYQAAKISANYDELKTPIPFPSASLLDHQHQSSYASLQHFPSRPPVLPLNKPQSHIMPRTPALKAVQVPKSKAMSLDSDTHDTASYQVVPNKPIGTFSFNEEIHSKKSIAEPSQIDARKTLQQSNFDQISESSASMQNGATNRANRSISRDHITPLATIKTITPNSRDSEIAKMDTHQPAKQIFTKDVAIKKAHVKDLNDTNAVTDATHRANNERARNLREQPACFQSESNVADSQKTLSAAPSAVVKKQTDVSVSGLHQENTQQLSFLVPSELRKKLNVLSTPFVPKIKITTDIPSVTQAESLASPVTTQTDSESERPKQSSAICSETDLITKILQNNDNKMHVNILFLRCQFEQQRFKNIQDLMRHIENDRTKLLRINDCWVEYSR